MWTILHPKHAQRSFGLYVLISLSADINSSRIYVWVVKPAF